MSVVIPDSRFELPELFVPNKKPTGNVTVINDQHWLYGNIVFYARLGRGAAELVTNQALTLFGDASFDAVTEHGDGLKSDGVSDGAYADGNDRLYAMDNQCSFVWAGEMDSYIRYGGMVVIPYSATAWS